MKVKVLRPHKTGAKEHAKGEVYETSADYAKMLIDQKLVEEVKENKVEPGVKGREDK